VARRWRKRIAIAGIGDSDLGTVPGMDSYELSRQALVRALDDCGLKKNEIDGVMTTGSFSVLYPMHSILFCEYVGLRPRYTSIMQIGGATHILNVLTAANAIDAGMCDVALVTSAESLRSFAGFQRLMRLFGDASGDMTAIYSAIGHPDFEVPYGTTLISQYALYANRHMAEFGTTHEQLAQVAVSIRKHASLHPQAQKRQEITIEDVLNAKPIASPFTKDECSLISDGGAAIIVTTLERARDLKKKPVELLGGGAKTDQEHAILSRSFTTSPAVSAGRDCFEMAGVTPADVDFAELYDCFSVTPLITLEDFGFCKKGEGGAFVEGGKRIELGGELPIVTHGGCLSHCHPGLPAGIFHITEAVKQLRGEVEPARQVKDAKIGFVSGVGGILSSVTALLLGRE
jgi:acetyl-CoA acetyltransferase